ncbi:response regulator [Mucilaginibacter sp.]|uniref:response regulator n=1 Tax=Mucilaginibacter sp. TaxID=1882438 RepID=UPI0025F7839D|nr:response regulator [Mucilaginibacter sp.]
MRENRVLAIEDDQDILDTYEYLLKDAGYQVSLSLNGEDIFKQIMTAKPHLIILDIRLGNLDGGENLAAAKQKHNTSGSKISICAHLVLI